MKEVTIAGGGLAGLSLGIALRENGVPVVLHEAASYPRHRVCGEFISGVDSAILQELGIAEALADARPLTTTQWFLGGDPVLAARLPVPARGISRYRLDARLAERFEGAGGRLQTTSRLPPDPIEGHIWAAGRKPDRKSEWLGLKMHVTGLEQASDLEMHVGEGGYVGLAPVEEGRVNVCGLFRRTDLKGKGSEFLLAHLEASGLEVLAERLRQAGRDEASMLGVSALQLGRQEQVRDLCVLGDAESIIPPFTGNGMSMAFEAAAAARDPIMAWANGGTTWGEAREKIRTTLVTRFRRRLFTARVLHPFLLSACGRNLLSLTARSGILPFRPLLRLLR